jgi:asparagine synthase (glutamine-hydrolysing)
MCGICGLAYTDQRPGNRELLRKMNDAIRHRGPDSEGFFADDGIGLAVRRLSIIDVKGGDQPISNEDDSAWIVLNGEIYNYPEIRSHLEVRGHRFKTRSDTECILHLYEEEGNDCLGRLRGMFAFAVWDRNRRRLLLARDRLGKKPLYYAVQEGGLYFSSELGSLVMALPVNPEIDLEAIDLYLSLQYIPEPRTVYKGVFKLPASHRLVWECGEFVIQRYWDYTYQPKITATEEDLAAELRSRLLEAVQIRLMSEVPLGAALKRRAIRSCRTHEPWHRCTERTTASSRFGMMTCARLSMSSQSTSESLLRMHRRSLYTIFRGSRGNRSRWR